MKKIVLLTDYRGAFWSTVRNESTLYSLDVPHLARQLLDQGASVKVMKFADINFRDGDFHGTYVIYQSSEDHLLSYKSYIEDVLLGVEACGGVLVPGIQYFRAHHNKAFAEILRELCGHPALWSPRARTYGTLEELNASQWEYPVVVKPSAGCGSVGVTLARNRAELLMAAAKVSRSAGMRETLREWKMRVTRRRSGYVARSLHRNKFIVQEFIQGLEGDFKVLAYGNRLFVLARRNRQSDFRASGSGVFTWPQEPPEALLDFAERAHGYFDNPMSSFDIGYDGSRCYLLEFQFVAFGTLTLESAKWCFERCAGKWTRIESIFRPEDEFAKSFINWVRSRESPTGSDPTVPLLAAGA